MRNPAKNSACAERGRSTSMSGPTRPALGWSVSGQYACELPIVLNQIIPELTMRKHTLCRRKATSFVGSRAV